MIIGFPVIIFFYFIYMKFLIVGLGNIGAEYKNTRHNIGFDVLDTIANDKSASFANDRYADVVTISHRGKQLILIKPTTYMNLSGKAINYWMQKEKIALENILVITDDLSLPLGKIRIRMKGGAGGHNGLKNTEEILKTENYARLRFGIGSDFSKGNQVDFVLGKWKDEEKELLNSTIQKATEAVLSIPSIGIERTMNIYNTK